MNTKTRRFADAGVIALTASILFTGILPATSAQAAPAPATVVSTGSPVVNYVALGDSYAAGQGAGFYENACLQSELSYPELLDDVKHVKLITDTSCSGATTADVIGQLSAIKTNKKIDVVTLTVGANDVGGAAVELALLPQRQLPRRRWLYPSSHSDLPATVQLIRIGWIWLGSRSHGRGKIGKMRLRLFIPRIGVAFGPLRPPGGSPPA